MSAAADAYSRAVDRAVNDIGRTERQLGDVVTKLNQALDAPPLQTERYNTGELTARREVHYQSLCDLLAIAAAAS